MADISSALTAVLSAAVDPRTRESLLAAMLDAAPADDAVIALPFAA